MKLISWNVNGIRACIGKGFEESFAALDADIFCLQERMPAGAGEAGTSGILSVLELCQQTGIFRNCCFYKKEPLSVAYGIGIEEHDKEGRVITLEYENFIW